LKLLVGPAFRSHFLSTGYLTHSRGLGILTKAEFQTLGSNEIANASSSVYVKYMDANT
jgi:hypothetical protein